MARKSAVLIPAIIAAVAVGGLGVAFIPADLVGPERTEVTLTYDWSATGPETRELIQFPPFPPEHFTESLEHLALLI